jgi:hypothetical protein
LLGNLAGGAAGLVAGVMVVAVVQGVARLRGVGPGH